MKGRRRAVVSIVVAFVVLGCGDDASNRTSTTAASGSSSSVGSGAQGSGGGGSGGGPGGTGSGGDSTGGAGGGGGAARAICPGGPYADDPLPADPTLVEIQGGFDFLEGPVWFADLGVLFFSNMHFGLANPAPLNGPQATMHRFTPPSTFEDFVDNSSTNGLGIALDGQMIACTHDTRSVSRFDLTTKAKTEIVTEYMGGEFNSPNDVVVRSDGAFYFTDPDWQLSQQSELPTAVYRVSPSNEVTQVDQLPKPNGITLSPDEKTLYVGAVDGVIRAYAVADDGSTGPATDFAQASGPDGFAMDCAGNLYVTFNDGVAVFAPDGSSVGTIGGVGNATNAAFGGPERKTLYVTAGSSLYSLELNVPGYPY